MAQPESSISLEHLSDEQWPFPFSRSDWEMAPLSVRVFILLLVKRIEVLKAKFSENSQNTSRPPSPDSPYRKPRTKTNPAKKKTNKKRGERKGYQCLVSGSSQHAEKSGLQQFPASRPRLVTGRVN